MDQGTANSKLRCEQEQVIFHWVTPRAAFFCQPAIPCLGQRLGAGVGVGAGGVGSGVGSGEVGAGGVGEGVGVGVRKGGVRAGVGAGAGGEVIVVVESGAVAGAGDISVVDTQRRPLLLEGI